MAGPEGGGRAAPVGGAATTRTVPPEPRLQVTPSQDLDAIRKAEIDRLSSYGWVDRKAGVVHIPIERAIDLVAAEAERRLGRPVDAAGI